ncbi:hypothetical protein AXG93_2841s1060 [Marchantia polymorpha subsp. ruderalis]|uniref:Uncharacterized protein n=1 Tax=Marchantia polymorpha subsp. ruderalis TaxID=1480154 RepID=A0A176WSQ2_MARPO|nr:hypothetical protein AXG93_2841s1060 [Marchantia polymorpha subsp. ruderalis]
MSLKLRLVVSGAGAQRSVQLQLFEINAEEKELNVKESMHLTLPEGAVESQRYPPPTGSFVVQPCRGRLNVPAMAGNQMAAAAAAPQPAPAQVQIREQP